MTSKHVGWVCWSVSGPVTPASQTNKVHTSAISTHYATGFWPGYFSITQFYVAEKQEKYSSVQEEQISKVQEWSEFQRREALIESRVLMLNIYLRESRMVITVLRGALQEVVFVNHLKILWCKVEKWHYYLNLHVLIWFLKIWPQLLFHRNTALKISQMKT